MATEPDTEAEAGRLLHLRFLADDPVAVEQVFARYYELLQTHVRGYIGRKQLFLEHADIDEVADHAVVDALESYLRRPESFDPTRRTLAGYLRMSAERDFLNRFNREIKRAKAPDRKTDIALVRFEPEAWNSIADEGTDLVAEAEDTTAAGELLDFIRSCARTDEERIVLDLMLRSVRSTSMYAGALGIGHLTSKDQQSRVTTIKERLSKRLKRGYRGAAAD